MRFILLVLILLSTLPMAIADEPLYESPKRDGLFYYRIGGGRPFTALPRMRVTTINISLGANLTGLHCGQLDPKVSIKNALNRAKRGLDDMMNQLQNAATGAISNLPGYLLMKFNPDLYETLMSSVAQANFNFSLATKSCEQMANEIANGNDPYEDFATFSVADKWKVGIGTGGVDAVDLKESSSHSDDGFIWVDGLRAGGLNQPVAEPASDAVKAGYNMILNRDVTDTSTPSTTLRNESQLVQTFQNPSQIEAWVKNVLGDDELCVGTGCTGASKPGSGLWSVLQGKMDDVWPQLEGLYAGTIDPTPGNLRKASAPGVVITNQVIQAMRSLDPDDAQIYAGRLLNEIALARTIDESLLVKRALNTGLREANISRHATAVQMIQNRIDFLQSEMDNLLSEIRLRNEVVSKTAGEVLMMSKAFRDNAKSRKVEQSGSDVEISRGVFENGN